MTYLDLVNNILVRLRERTVSTVNQNTYSTLIGQLVNDAKLEVESAWNWSHLKTTLTATTGIGVFGYILTGTSTSFSTMDVINDTSNESLAYATPAQFNEWYLKQQAPSGRPTHYSYNGKTSDNETQVDLYPVPDAVYDIRFNLALKPADLAADTDVLALPLKPVQLLAYAKAVEERGEDGGVNTGSAYRVANSSLSDAIAFDSQLYPDTLIWESC